MSKAFRVILLLPAAWWIYLIATAQYGADPAKSFNHKTGEMALYYLLGNLVLGALIGFGVRFPARLRFVLLHRRFLGVVTFLFLVCHAFLYLAMEGFAPQGFTQLVTKLYLILGLSAWLILLVLTLTSNDFSLKKLGFRRWKFIHRFVHLAAAIVTAHVLLIEKGDLVKWGILMGLLWAIQVACFVYRKTKKTTH